MPSAYPSNCLADSDLSSYRAYATGRTENAAGMQRMYPGGIASGWNRGRYTCCTVWQKGGVRCHREVVAAEIETAQRHGTIKTWSAIEQILKLYIRELEQLLDDVRFDTVCQSLCGKGQVVLLDGLSIGLLDCPPNDCTHPSALGSLTSRLRLAKAGCSMSTGLAEQRSCAKSRVLSQASEHTEQSRHSSAYPDRLWIG